jgi:hypothetical protein
MSALILALDKSMRTVDKFGRMYIKVSNISKATVNPYRGSEIPGYERLGLDPDRIYMMLRDPDELKAAADTFNNIPLLDRHIPVTAQAPAQEFVVGSTGTDAQFSDPYLRNSLVVWTATAIAGINTNQQRELSCAYSYDADMTPGVYEGKPYDGIMRNIKGNHVALVEVGRAGPDVVVGDSKLSEKPRTMKRKLSTNARIAVAALAGALRPVLAQDAQIGDLTAIVGGVKSLKSANEQERIIAAVTKEYGDKLAQDATLDHVAPLLAQLAQDEEPEAPAKPPKVTDADDEDDEDDDKKKDDDKPAMDAAISAAVRDAEARTVARMQAIQQAERDVEPHVGRLAMAMDSAEAVYKVALDAAKVDLTDVPPSAYRALVRMLPKPGTVTTPTPTRTTLAQDAADASSAFGKIFSGASQLKGGV